MCAIMLTQFCICEPHRVLSQHLQTEAEATSQGCPEKAMKANPAKFQCLLSKCDNQATILIRGQKIEYSKSITDRDICIADNLNILSKW